MEIIKHLADTDVSFTQVLKEPHLIQIAMDMGSTETRTIQFDMQGNIGDTLKIDSNYAIVTRDLSNMTANTRDIESQLEMVITDTTADQKASPLFSQLRIVKGKLMRVLNSHTTRTTANSSKIDQVPTFVNCLANTALNILLRGAEEGGIPNGVTEVDLTVSLPPEDTSSPVRLDVFKQRLAGVYAVEFVRLGCTIQISLSQERIFIFSESNAVAITQQMQAPAQPDDTLAFIDVGGRSTGISFVYNGVLLEDGCVTESIGGQKMKELVAQRVCNQLNTQIPADDTILQALDTGKIRMGAKYVDISALITESKREVAEQIFNAFMLALDRNGLQAQQLTRVFCSGRSFGISKDGEFVTSPSMMTMLEEMFKERAPYTEFTLVDNADPIVYGLVCGRFMCQ